MLWGYQSSYLEWESYTQLLMGIVGPVFVFKVENDVSHIELQLQEALQVIILLRWDY